MAEKQNIEWKQSWRDEYLKTICAFANTEGGTLTIGINDSGATVGVADAKSFHYLKIFPQKLLID